MVTSSGRSRKTAVNPEWAKRYREDETVTIRSLVAESEGVTYHAMRRALIDSGVTFRTPPGSARRKPGARKRYSATHNTMEKLLISLLQNGPMTVRQLATAASIAPVTASGRMAEMAKAMPPLVEMKRNRDRRIAGVYVLTESGKASATRAKSRPVLDAKKVVRLYVDRRQTAEQIAGDTFNAESVRTLLRANGVTIRRFVPPFQGRIVPKPEWADRYRNEPGGIRVLAESVGVSYTYMHKALRDLGVKLNPPGKRPRRVE